MPRVELVSESTPEVLGEPVTQGSMATVLAFQELSPRLRVVAQKAKWRNDVDRDDWLSIGKLKLVL